MVDTTASPSQEADESVIFVGEGPLSPLDEKGNQKIAPFWRNNPTSHPKPLPVTNSMNHQLKHVTPVKRLAAGFEINESGLLKLDKASVAELTSCIVNSLGQKGDNEILRKILSNTEYIRQGQVVYPSISDNAPPANLRDQINIALERLADNCVKDYNNISQTQKHNLQETKGQIVDELTKILQKELFKLAKLIDDSNDSLHSNITSLLSQLNLDKDNDQGDAVNEVKLAVGTLIEKMDLMNASSVNDKLEAQTVHSKNISETLKKISDHAFSEGDSLKLSIEDSVNQILAGMKHIQSQADEKAAAKEMSARMGDKITRDVSVLFKKEMETIEPVLNSISVLSDQTEALVRSFRDQMNDNSLKEAHAFFSNNAELEKCIREAAASSLLEANTFVGPLLKTFCGELENYVPRESHSNAVNIYEDTINQQKTEIEMLKRRLMDAEGEHERIHAKNNALLVEQDQKANQVICLLQAGQTEKERILTQEVERLGNLVDFKDSQVSIEIEKQHGLEQDIARLKSEHQLLSEALDEQSNREALTKSVNHLLTMKRNYKDSIKRLQVKVEGLQSSVAQAKFAKEAIVQDIIKLKGDAQRELVINYGDMNSNKRICEPVISGTLMKKRNYADGMSAQGGVDRFDKRVFSSPTQFTELSGDSTTDEIRAKSQRITHDKENLY